MSTILLIAALSVSSWAHDTHQHSEDCPHTQGQVEVAPPPVTGPAPWAGIPLEALPGLGLGEPRLDTHRSAWRAPLAQGGFVRLVHYPDVDQAIIGFSFEKLSASTASLAPMSWEHSPDRDVQAVGDEAGMLVMRDANLVLVVRDHGEEAGRIAQALQAAMVAEAPAGEPIERDLGGRTARWDSCGRLID